MDILGIEKLSLVDYDGFVSATVFTGNCNFKCPFCHNATLVLDYKDLPVIPQSEIIDYLKKRKGILEGLCITGGEPTLNKDLPEFCEKIKNIGYSVKVDTNGTNPQMIKTLFENNLADYFAMDIKNDFENYAPIIGYTEYDTANIKKSVEFFLSGNAKYEFRTTLIKEFHTKENIIAIAKWIKGADKYFLQKFKNGDNSMSQDLNEVPLDTAKEYLEILKNYIPNTNLRGYDL